MFLEPTNQPPPANVGVIDNAERQGTPSYVPPTRSLGGRRTVNRPEYPAPIVIDATTKEGRAWAREQQKARPLAAQAARKTATAAGWWIDVSAVSSSSASQDLSASQDVSGPNTSGATATLNQTADMSARRLECLHLLEGDDDDDDAV